MSGHANWLQRERNIFGCACFHALPKDFPAATHFPFCRIDYLGNMKNLKVFAFMILVAVVTVGCSTGLKKILPKQDGTWLSATIAFKSYVNSTLDSSYTIVDGSVYFFDKSGSGARVDNLGTERSLTWVVNPNGDIVNICYPTVSSVPCADYLVVSSSKNRQEWRVTTVGSANGEWTEQDFVLTRIE
ncbi:MAG: hypothetical protein RLZZ519_1017 [Bacteroidota bacterium]|jgi:hypothetical protein